MQEYIAKDSISKEILNSAKLLQAVEVNALILGENGVGKKSLAKYILPQSEIYEAKNLQKDIVDDVLTLQNEAIIIDKINELTNIDLLLKWIEENRLIIEENDNIFAFVALAYLNPEFINEDLSGSKKFAKTFFGLTSKDDFEFEKEAWLIDNKSEEVEWIIDENLLNESWHDKDFIYNKYKGKLLVVDVDDIDYQNNKKDFAGIIDKIDATLFGLF